jgi:hypothetical protein
MTQDRRVFQRRSIESILVGLSQTMGWEFPDLHRISDNKQGFSAALQLAGFVRKFTLFRAALSRRTRSDGRAGLQGDSNHSNRVKSGSSREASHAILPYYTLIGLSLEENSADRPELPNFDNRRISTNLTGHSQWFTGRE